MAALPAAWPGLAWTRLEQNLTRVTTGAATTITSTPTWEFGWVAGAGAQARLWSSNWLARIEYLHYDFGRSANSIEGFVSNGALSSLVNSRTSGHVTADVVRVGLDYKLD